MMHRAVILLALVSLGLLAAAFAIAGREAVYDSRRYFAARRRRRRRGYITVDGRRRVR